MFIFILLILPILLFSACNKTGGFWRFESEGQHGRIQEQQASTLIQPEAATIAERFIVPDGYERVPVASNSFGEYLRNLPLKPHGSKVHYFDGRIKARDVHEAVVDLDVGTRDLQQCADAVIRLRAEYLYQEQRYEEIHFNFTNGFNAEYAKWREGYRIKVEGNSVSWIKSSNPSQSYEDFRKYLDLVFAYAGTLSLAQELTLVQVAEMGIGDVFIQGGSPGHCVIVVDMAEHNETGEKLFMPAQEIHILKNGRDSSISPWYSAYFADELRTPEWTFQQEDLKGFPEN